MSLVNPPYEIGKNVTFAVIPCTIGSDGTITPGTSAAFTGRANRAHVHRRRISDEVHAIDSGIENNIPILTSFQVTISEVRRYSPVSSAANVGEEAYNGNSFAEIVITTAVHTYTYFGLLSEFDIPIEAGGIIQELTLIPADNGSTNPTIV